MSPADWRPNIECGVWRQYKILPVEEGGEGKDGGAKTCGQFRRFSQKVVDHGSETLEVFNETLGIFVLYGETLAFFSIVEMFVMYWRIVQQMTELSQIGLWYA